MSSVPPSDSHRSFNSELSNNSEDGIQKLLKEMIMNIIMHQELNPYFESLVRNVVSRSATPLANFIWDICIFTWMWELGFIWMKILPHLFLKLRMIELFHTHDLDFLIQVKEELKNLNTEVDRNSGNQAETCVERCLKLQFLKNVSLPILTNEEVQGEGHTSIEVALIDNLNEEVVDSGPEAFAKVEIVALKGHIGSAEGQDWTSEDFNRMIVREREGIYNEDEKKRKMVEGKQPLLDGDVHLHLHKGIGVVGKIKFRQYRRWMKNREFKLGARILDSFDGVRIKEATTKPFVVKDRRINCKRKRGPPSLSDDVCKLKNIRKDGKDHKLLQQKNINTVEDFLIQLFRDPQNLQSIIGLKTNQWTITLKHARMCAIDKPICYYYSSQQKIGVVFSIIEGVLGQISGCKYFTMQDLSEKDKADARVLALNALNHWQDVLCFNDSSSLLQYAENYLPTTKGVSSPPNLQIPCGNNTSFWGIDSFIPRNDNVEEIGLCSTDNMEICEEVNSSLSGNDLQSSNSSNRDPLMEVVENYFRVQKAQISWKKLYIVVKISMKK